MTSNPLIERAQSYLDRLCLEIPGRRVGSRGNRQAADYIAGVYTHYGYQPECQQFDCLDWTHGDVQLRVEDESFEAFISPYSLGCNLSAPLVAASSIEELQGIDPSQKLLLLYGKIAREQLMPKNFPFFNPDHHKQVIQLLETRPPEAIIAATTRNPELAGGLYPFPLIEDGDFDIPSVYMTQEQGERFVSHAGEPVSLAMNATRLPAQGCNVIARTGVDQDRRIVFFAHLDAKSGTPGALDNAAGVVVLLLLAELLVDYDGQLGIEIVALNGEDHYSAAGEIRYLASHALGLPGVVLGINIDAAGYHVGDTAYSFYACPEEIEAAIRKTISARQGMIEGQPWYQSDHSLFIQNSRPAMAFTSERFMELTTGITHTAKDRPELVDTSKLVDIALALRDLVLELDEIPA